MSSLYLEHFGLNKPPFQITPDLGFFFAGGRRGDILSALLHVAQHEEGIITLVAEVGSGKTLLARLMLSRLTANICTIYLANPSFSRDEILGAIGRDLGLTQLPEATEARVAALQNELLRRHAAGQRVLLVVDEAHAMPPESLEEVRLLSNLETDQHKLINIMLFGQPELDETLGDRRMRQVRDRVVHRFQLQPLPADEASAYVDHRLRAAGWVGGALFAPAAMALLIKASGGRARRINLIADKALLGAYASGQSMVQVHHVRQAVGELHDDVAKPSLLTRWSWQPWLAAAILLLVIVLGAQAWHNQRAVAGESKSAPVAALTNPIAPTAPAALVLPAPPAAPSSAAATSPPAPPTAVASPVKAELPRPTAANSPSEWMAMLEPFLHRTRQFVRQPDLGGYTVQIASLPREATVGPYLQRVREQVDSDRIYAQLSHYNGKDFVAVFIGNYSSAAQANAALIELPVALKTNKPIVRTWIKIRLDQPP